MEENKEKKVGVGKHHYWPLHPSWQKINMIQRIWKSNPTYWEFLYCFLMGKFILYISNSLLPSPCLPPLSQEMDEFQTQLHSPPQQHMLVVMPTRHCLSRQYWTWPAFFMVLKKTNEIMENSAKVSTSRLFYNKSPRYLFSQKTSHFREMRNQKQTKNL